MEDRSVSVLEAKTIAQGYASLTMFDANQELAINLSEMKDLIKNVKTGEVTYAVRDTEYKGVEIKKNHWMGIANGEIISSTEDRLEAVCKLMEELVEEDSEIVTVIYGNDVEPKELEQLMLSIDTHYPDVEIEVIEGNQNIYSFILAVE
jgi:dihydroxyacetone kinase-like predicted kinase